MKSKQKYLIDTHCWLRWHIEPEKLPPKVFKIIENGDTFIYFSSVSAWEIVIKYSLKKLKLPMPPNEYIPKRLELSFMDLLPVQLEHVLQVQNLPNVHKDPFDRLLIAQAVAEELIIITEDQQFKNYDIERLL
jgi:PIN domain nuclease of toxin-antitoxin system